MEISMSIRCHRIFDVSLKDTMLSLQISLHESTE
jgi:hypothetical protein